MDWIKLLKTPLPTVLVVLGCVLAVIAAAAGELHWGGTFALSHLDPSGRIGLGSLGVLLCAAGVYLYRSGGHENSAKKKTLTITPELRTQIVFPEFTMIRLKGGCESWKEIGDGNSKFERNRDYQFAEDPVFEIVVENNSSNTFMFYKAGVRLLRREPDRGGTMGSWDYRTLEVQAELTVHCPDEWKRGVIDDRNSRVSKAFVKPIEMNKGGSRYLFTLKLENFVDPNSASSSEVRFYLVTGNDRTAESSSIWLFQ
jgi:hypothetical protein